MTLSEQILSARSGQERLRPGQFILVDVDLGFANDLTAPPAIKEFRKYGSQVFDPGRVALVPDHFTPCKDIESAELVKLMRNFAHEQGIERFYEIGRVGVEHVLLPDAGLITPGMVVIGADSHTCTHGALGAFATGVGSTDFAFFLLTGKAWFRVPESIRVLLSGRLQSWVGGKDIVLYLISRLGVDGARYQTLEFAGETLAQLSMDDRFTICNMAIEAGAKNGIIPPDNVTMEYLYQVNPDWVNRHPGFALDPGKKAVYSREMKLDVSKLEPYVAAPDLPSNGHPVSELKEVKLDQVVIGSCTNGRLSDLKTAASVIKGRKVSSGTRLIVIPATQDVFRQAMAAGYLDTFVESGAVVTTPTCGPCLGGHTGVLAEGEVGLSTTNRNFVGRMGHPKSRLYLSSPAVAAASAVTGRITHPSEVV
ncbi:MAG TPA: 3-isopropylmalate dehydratase large subunit [bacterium]|nr:3-isopropylmalate dehydratase large subunit [bacterium]HNS48509.1 3-isopropylmalate dehydratase large subunit [bacterium]